MYFKKKIITGVIYFIKKIIAGVVHVAPLSLSAVNCYVQSVTVLPAMLI